MPSLTSSCPPSACKRQGDSLAAPAVVGQGEGTPCCANPRPDCMDPRPDCMGMLMPGTGIKCKALAAGREVGAPRHHSEYADLLQRIAALAHSGLCTFHLEVVRDRLNEIRALCEPWDVLKRPERRA